jgi:bifunctional DNase/RNase|tara:strand:+ start:253 stop:843 length:591 start_codon:yes stop_codon:yes gene_type:complete
MKKIELDIVALSHSITQSHNYAVVLGEQDGRRRLPIVIGGFEAQAIAVAMERMTPSRPLTHDLMRNAFETFSIDLKEVVINDLQDGIFYARLLCVLNGDIVEIDSRTSDALAMAVRFECPIYTYEFILDAAGVILEEGEETESETSPIPIKEKKESSLKNYSLPDLEEMLSEVIGREDYEKAARIRDEMSRREQEM